MTDYNASKAIALNITILARLLETAVKDNNDRAAMKYVGQIGMHLNKIIGEMTKGEPA